MKYKARYIIILSFFCTALFSQDIIDIDEGKLDIKKITRVRLGAIYSDANFKGSFNNEAIPGFVAYDSYLIKLSKKNSFGLGGGFELYRKNLFLPTYLNLLTEIRKNILLDIQAGYSFGWKRKSEYYENYIFKGGVFSSLGTGYKFKISNEIKSFLEISYKFQKAALKSGTLPNSTVNFHSVIFTFGLLLD